MNMAENMQQPQREIAIFWDYENVPLPSWCSATQAAKTIVDAVSHYGRIVDRRLYYDFEKMRYRPRDCSSLDSSGFDLVNTPTRNNKETLDKKLIADVLTFAWDSAVRNDNKKPCVVLLTGDGDYAYTLSKLRDRGIMTVVMVGRDCTVASILVDTADVAMSLEDDVLKDVATKKSPTVSKNNMSSIRPGTPTQSNNGQDPVMTSVCQWVKNFAEFSPDGWVDSGQVSVHIQQMIRQGMQDAPPELVKQYSREARQKAEANQLVQLGRRMLDTQGDKREIIPSNDKRLNLSPEVYIRLLPKGEQLLTESESPRQYTTPTKSKGPTSPLTTSPPQRLNRTVFMPRLPRDTDVRQLVSILEEELAVTVRRARIELSDRRPTCNAYVELSSEEEAGILLQTANKAAGGKGIFIGGKCIGVMSNNRSGALVSKGGDNVYYESKSLIASSPRTPPSSKGSKMNASPAKCDTSHDASKFCIAVYQVESRSGQEVNSLNNWVNAGTVGERFRSQLESSYVKSATKEDISSRFKQARDKAIQDGLAEIGRRHLDSDTYTAIALYSGTRDNRNLSPNVYFRLLSSGQKLAIEAQATKSSTEQPDKTRLVFLSNLPSSTTATQLAEYLETLECQAKRIELEERRLKLSTYMAAHVECVSTQDATRLLRKAATHCGIVFCGMKIPAVVDRLTPEQLSDLSAKTSNPDMSYTRDTSTSVTSVSATEVDLMDSSVPSEIMASAASNEELQQTESMNDSTKQIMRQDSVTSDPFEDLISWT